MPFAAVNGQRLFYEDTGGSAPVLVFSHGLLMDHRMFAPQVAAFRHGWRCISWDERGHGTTATPGQCAPFSYYDSANDLVALLDHLGVERAVLVGMSQGGYLSLRAGWRPRQSPPAARHWRSGWAGAPLPAGWRWSRAGRR